MEPSKVFLIVVLLAAAGVLVWWWRLERLRRLAMSRLVPANGRASSGRAGRSFPPRYRWVPVAVAGITAVGCWWWLSWPVPFVLAIAMIVGVLGVVVESMIASRRVLLLETQLTEVIDGLVGALRAGMALPKAVEAVMRESRPPLRGYLEDVVARLRLGEEAPTVFRELSNRVPLESVQLFCLTLSAQWAGGGRVASALAAVGRTLRDRIEVSRRVRAQAVEANVSVVAMMGISYGVGWIMWRANPASFTVFLTSDLGLALTSGAMVLQAVGILWVRRLSRINY